MTLCLYCGLDKEDSRMTLEHVVPQSLGGAHLSNEFKIKNVCQTCNNNLGLFVDAAFERQWIVSNAMQLSALACFNSESTKGVPLICMGNSSLEVPSIEDNEICELWLGPWGEQIFWIRQRDENLYWYAGGNPRTAKEKATRAYFFFSEKSKKDFRATWLAFKDAFDGKKKVKKIMCTDVEGENFESIGFQPSDALDEERIKYFKTITADTNSRKNSLSFYLDFDLRFASKIAIGMAYALFGEKVIDTLYMRELRKGLWHKQGDPSPNIRGTSVYSENRRAEDVQIFGHENAVVIIIAPAQGAISLSFSIGTSVSFSVMCVDAGCLDEEDFEKIGHGIVLVLFKYLQKGFQLSLFDYVSHKLGRRKHEELSKIEAFIQENRCIRRSL